MPKRQKQRNRPKTVIEKPEKIDKKNTSRKSRSEDSFGSPAALLVNETTDDDIITESVQWKSKTSLSEESLNLANTDGNVSDPNDEQKVIINRPSQRSPSPITYKTTIILHPEKASQPHPHYQRVTTVNVASKRETPPRIIESSSQTNKVSQLDDESNTVEWLISSIIILAIALLLIRFF